MAFALFLATMLGLLAWTWVRQKPASSRGPALLKLGAVLAVPLAGYLALTGRLHVLGLILALAYPLLRRLGPGLWQRRRATTGGGQQSTVSTPILEMTLDHDSGQLSGQVLQGPLQGLSLEQLEEHQFVELLRYCRKHDSESARLLETYLDKRYGEAWRADDNDEKEETGGGSAGAAVNGTGMSRDEAYEILGLPADASPEAIIKAHRRLMQRLHPDRGGSAYLAARINAARKTLLD